MSAPSAIVRPPSADLGAGERTFVERAPIDAERALAQHTGYCRALGWLGFEVVELAPHAELPDAPFVEDPLLLLDGGWIATRPGAESRRAEVQLLAGELEALPPFRGRAAGAIEAPGTVEGGDVLEVDGLLLVGQSTRTNHAGLKQLAHLVLPLGYRVKAAEVRSCLHLKTACSYLGRGVLLANPAWADLGRAGEHEVVPVDPREPFGANAIALGGKVLMSAAAPRTAERVAVRGFEVELVDLSEFERAEAGLTCLSLRTAAPG